MNFHKKSQKHLFKLRIFDQPIYKGSFKKNVPKKYKNDLTFFPLKNTKIFLKIQKSTQNINFGFGLVILYFIVAYL